MGLYVLYMVNTRYIFVVCIGWLNIKLHGLNNFFAPFSQSLRRARFYHTHLVAFANFVLCFVTEKASEMKKKKFLEMQRNGQFFWHKPFVSALWRWSQWNFNNKKIC